jgi:hypothetical protein
MVDHVPESIVAPENCTELAFPYTLLALEGGIIENNCKLWQALLRTNMLLLLDSSDWDQLSIKFNQQLVKVSVISYHR